MKALGMTLLYAIVSSAVSSPTLAQADGLGQYEYLGSCASCHGTDASGQGPMAEFLNVEVPNLTGLSLRNDGQFPMLEVLRFIDGRACGPAIDNRPCPRPNGELGAHGRAMPVWGNRYKDEAVFGNGASKPSENPEAVVLGRILALAYYLESIQK
jgi:hypothetical protein